MENPVSQNNTSLESKAKSGASWFYWIAGLSVVNSAVTLFGSTWGFIAGLGITQAVDGIVSAADPGASWMAFAVNLVLAGACVGVGVLAHRNAKAYLTGMVLYGLDGLLFLMVGDWLGLGFHGLVLFFMFSGFQARRELDRLAAAQGAHLPKAA